MDIERLWAGPSLVTKADDDRMVIDHFITTEHLDRHSHVVLADGMIIPPNGVRVFWQHGFDFNRSDEAIATPLSLTAGVKDGKRGIQASTEFYRPTTPGVSDPFPARLYDKVKSGLLNSWSIGYRPLKTEDREIEMADGQKLMVTHIVSWELVEYSLVGIPANPYATNSAFEDDRKAGRISCEQLKQHGIMLKCGGCGHCTGHGKAEATPASIGAAILAEHASGQGAFLRRMSEAANRR